MLWPSKPVSCQLFPRHTRWNSSQSVQFRGLTEGNSLLERNSMVGFLCFLTSNSWHNVQSVLLRASDLKGKYSENGDRTYGLTDVSTRTKQGEEMVARLSNYLH